MDPKSGRISLIENEEQARANGLVPLFADEVDKLKRLPEVQRPGELLRLRAIHPLARLPGLSEDDIRQLRNAAKRERRSRRGT